MATVASVVALFGLLSACLALPSSAGIRSVTDGPGDLANGLILKAEDYPLHQALSAFTEFKTRHSKTYASPVEEQARFEVFAENWRHITSHNAANKPYQLEVNEFADMTWEEFRASRLAAMQNCSAQTGSPRILLRGAAAPSPPAKRDWREEGIVSPVKNQGHCGSCWTFSTTGALEAAYTQKHGKPANFSEQQLVDCAWAFNNMGCGGGLPSQAYEYVLYNGGIDTEAAYPYVGVNGECHFSKSGVGAMVSGVYNVTQFDEEELQGAVGFVRPTSIAFEVVGDFRFYKSGVYESDTCGDGPDTVNHAVLAVGYDTTADTPYWIIKNSWGAGWGDEGYFKMKLGSNMCGVATCASYPIVE